MTWFTDASLTEWGAVVVHQDGSISTMAGKTEKQRNIVELELNAVLKCAETLRSATTEIFVDKTSVQWAKSRAYVMNSKLLVLREVMKS